MDGWGEIMRYAHVRGMLRCASVICYDAYTGPR